MLSEESTQKEIAMSMRGEIISREYQSMEWVQDKDGKEYACYHNDVENFNEENGLTREQKEKCLDTSQILGDSW